MGFYLALTLQATNSDQFEMMAMDLDDFSFWPSENGLYELIIRSPRPEISPLDIIQVMLVLERRGIKVVAMNQEQDPTKLVSVSFTLPTTARSAELRTSIGNVPIKHTIHSWNFTRNKDGAGTGTAEFLIPQDEALQKFMDHVDGKITRRGGKITNVYTK